jgi:hypothetical protein
MSLPFAFSILRIADPGSISVILFLTSSSLMSSNFVLTFSITCLSVSFPALTILLSLKYGLTTAKPSLLSLHLQR